MSVSQQAKRRGTILDEIMGYHRQELPKTMRAVPLADLRALANLAPSPVRLYEALQQPGVSLIAECKKASPSKGLLVAHYDPVELAESYVRAGASAISVLTDARHFQGSLAHLRDVKEAMTINLASLVPGERDPRFRNGVPVLRKDFIFHPYQVYESRAAGADAILLIAAVLADSELRQLGALSQGIGMDALVEVHDQEELERVLALRPRLIGINNRNLQTFEVDLDNTNRLQRLIPAEVLTVAESGIKTAEDIQRLKAMGVAAVLVGETLLRSKDVYLTTRDLVRAGSP